MCKKEQVSKTHYSPHDQIVSNGVEWQWWSISLTCISTNERIPNASLCVSETEGQVSLKFDVTAKMAPFVQIIAYAILPSELVVAHSADFSTEKCFSHKVSVRGVGKV